jgi:FKBP-type peptidyl-prolyl cis-trans isomerase SlyD
MTITNNKAVYMHYTLRDSDGNIMDQSEPNQPLAYLHGAGNIIPGLEGQLEGKSTGDKFQAVVQPEEGYGLHQEELVFKAPRENFQGDFIEVGMEVELNFGDETAVAVVTEVGDEEVSLDLNHPLAGEVLFFDVDIVNVRDASLEEISHGHIHGVGGVIH